MLADDAAALVERFLDADGFQVYISRPMAGADPAHPTITTIGPLQAVMRDTLPRLMGSGGVAQNTRKVRIIGALAALGPPGPTQFVPKEGDKLSGEGFERGILAVGPISMGSEIVTIDLQVMG